jgi:hypothetical protein
MRKPASLIRCDVLCARKEGRENVSRRSQRKYASFQACGSVHPLHDIWTTLRKVGVNYIDGYACGVLLDMFHSQKRDLSGLGSKSLPIRTSLHFLFLFPCPFPLRLCSQRGTHVREARYRRTRESVCHDHGLVVGTWATV